MKKIEVEKIIQNTMLGEFIVFYNSLHETLQKKQTLFISKNRTLNEYVEIQKKYAKDECVYSSEIVFCNVAKLNSLSLINFNGKKLLKNIATSSLSYKKFVAACNEINNLNL